MRKNLLSLLSLICIIFCGMQNLQAQCDVNNPYDKIVSGYHQSIALKTDGSFTVWGEDLNNAGTGNVLVPQEINVANYPNLLGTPLKATIGGSGGGGEEQAILLTSNGLYAWGSRGYVINTALTTSATFAKVLGNQFTSGNVDISTGLPTGVNPYDVKMMTASYGTLILLTNSGDVWTLSLLTGNLNANGAATIASTTWYKAKINSTTYLSNITAVRVQTSTGLLNAVIALKSDGKVYTWGSSTYLGNTTAAAALNYATQMTLPAEFSISNIPKMIAVTGGVKNSAAIKNSYYILSNGGALYSLGFNAQKQLGDFTTTERTSWVNAKIDNATNFSNASFITAQEHDASFPGIAVVTKSGNLYTWGENEGLALGRTTEGSFYDPGMPLGFTSGTDIALSAEMGGHTLVYLKQGTTQFCYVGHKISGSMGDGVSVGSYINTFDCSGTPSISICGSVPIAASTITSLINATPTSIIASGTSTSTITVRLKQANGTNLTSTGGAVVISTDKGTVNAATDNNDGTYTAVLTSSLIVEMATLSYTLNGAAGTNTASVNFTIATNPIITTTGTLSAFTTCSGTASAEQSFTVGGSNLTADLTITAPTGFELSTTSGSGFLSTITITQSGGTVTSTTVYARLSAAATGTPSGNITCTSTGATTQNISASATVNALPTITLGAVTNINTSATSFSLPYTATTGSPNQYSIATVAPTAMTGFSVVTNAALGSSPISIPAPASSVNTYNFTITAKNTTTGCVSSATPFTVQVVKDNSTIVVTGSTSFNYNASAQGPSTNTKTGSTGAVTYSYSGVSPTVYVASATAPTAVGTYQVIATLASDANYNGASSVAFAFEIVKANSTIVVTGLTSFNYNASAQGPSSNTKTGSTGAVTYSYSGVSPTVYVASATAPTAVGDYEVIATLVADADYNGAISSAYAFVIINNISTIVVTGSTSFTYNGSAQGPSTNTKTGSTGAVTYSYSGVSPTVYTATSTAPTAVGTYQVIATLASDANYPTASSVAYAFAIIPAQSTIVVSGATSVSYNCYTLGPSSNTKNGSTGAVTYTYQGTGTTSYGPSTVAPTNAGAYEVVANLAADANFNGTSSAAYAFTIQKINPTVVLADIVKIMGDPSFTITATSNSNGAIVYSMGTAAVATITGNTVSLVGLGISTITVTQAESINYNAGSTTATLTVTPSAPVTSNGTYVLGFSGNPSNTNLLITPVAGASINFYPAATGGSPTNTQTLPSTVGVYTFYVSQTISGIEGPRVAYVVTILPEIKTNNATYIIGGSKNPTNISSLVSFITSGSKPQWCDAAGNNCSNIAPALPTTAGVTIWCVKAIDTISGLASAPCIYDTVKMLTTASVMAITKLASKPLLNPDGTFTLQYKFTVSNLSSELLDSVQITDDLRSVFVSPVTYEIISLTAGAKLTANSSYNGNSQINLLGYPSKLLGLQSDTVLLVVKISPKGYSGSINNTALISGVSPLSGRVGPVLSNDPTNYNNSGSSKPTLTILPLLNIIIPSGFSPNNDGINDNFAIIHPYNSSVSLEVFNRWGNIVYKNGNYNNEWYGKGVGNFLGQDLPAGTYYYVVNATDKSNNQVSNFVGYLTLKR